MMRSPFCVTVDHQTLEDNTVTLRYRDTMQQDRVKIDDLFNIIDKACNIKHLLRKLNADEKAENLSAE